MAKPAMKIKKGVAKPAPEQQVQVDAETEVVLEKPDVSEAESAVVVADDMIAKTVHEIENLNNVKAFKLVATLQDNVEHDNFRLGGVLSMIQNQGWFMEKTYDNFRAYVENETSLAYRKATYLIQIYNGLAQSGVPWEKVKHLGWTKLKELASVLTLETVDDWVPLAEEMTTAQLIEHIKLSTAGTAEGGPAAIEKSDITTITFKLHATQKETIKEALAKCKHESGTDVDTQALENICLDFLGGTAKPKAKSFKEQMASKSLEEVLEVMSEVFPDINLEVGVPESEAEADA